MPDERKIIHIDMDMFFAAVELRDNPQLQGQPVAVGGKGDRGVISTANYEARRWGVHSALSTRRALELCPQLVLLEPHFEKYKAVSQQIRHIMFQYTDLVEPLSLDEAFLDVTQNKPGIELAVDIAREIKQKILAETGLTASAGVSYCKFLAKVGSDYRKPDGLCVIHPSRALQFIDALRIEQFWGVGQRTAQHMHRLGIFNGQQLRQFSREGLVREFGKIGYMFYDFARGIDPRPVVTEHIRKSVGCERTLEHDIDQQANVIIELYNLVLELEKRIQKAQFRGQTLTLKVKFHDFRNITRSITRPNPITEKDDILPLAKQLIEGVEYENDPIRLLGLSVSNEAAEEIPQRWRQLYFDFYTDYFPE